MFATVPRGDHPAYHFQWKWNDYRHNPDLRERRADVVVGGEYQNGIQTGTTGGVVAFFQPPPGRRRSRYLHAGWINAELATVSLLGD